MVWVERDGKLTAAQVAVGLDDDTFAEIKSGDLKVGDQVVISAVADGKLAKRGASPAASLRL